MRRSLHVEVSPLQLPDLTQQRIGSTEDCASILMYRALDCSSASAIKQEGCLTGFRSVSTGETDLSFEHGVSVWPDVQVSSSTEREIPVLTTELAFA